MNRNIILTIIVLTYNHSSTIKKCLESIVNQKTKFKYVIKVWDDCSTDGNKEIIKNIAKKYKNIELFIQNTNTFLNKYDLTQSYMAIQNVDTKYFSIIEGDDYWTDNSKIERAITFLENNPKYSGWGSDTRQVEKNGTVLSWVHDIRKAEIRDNLIEFGNPEQFLMTSARFFRNLGYSNLKILPIDYLIWNYHLAKGPIYYYDKITSEYRYGNANSFSSLDYRSISKLCIMQSYKICLLFDFKKDEYCVKYLKTMLRLLKKNNILYRELGILKLFFGIKYGWKIWFIINFVPYFGVESLNINYAYPRKKIKNMELKYKKIFNENNGKQRSYNLKKVFHNVKILKQAELDFLKLSKKNITLKAPELEVFYKKYAKLLKEVMLDTFNKANKKQLDLIRQNFSFFDNYIFLFIRSKINKEKQLCVIKKQRSIFQLLSFILLIFDVILIYLFIKTK